MYSKPFSPAMIEAGFVYQANPAFIAFMGPKPRFPCNFNEESLLLDRVGLAGALFAYFGTKNRTPFGANTLCRSLA